MDPGSRTLALRAEVLALITAEGPPPMPSGEGREEWVDRLAIAGSRLHPWLAYQLERTGTLRTVPEPTRGILQAATRASAVRELRRRAQFVECAAALDEAGIPFVVLKGMALSYLGYPGPSLRPMSDIDLWVQSPRREDALRILRGLGWRIPERYAVHALRREETVLLELPGAASIVELHTQPLSIARDVADGPAVWQRCVSRVVAGHSVRVCSASDQLVHLAIHLARKHGFHDGLLGLLDLTLCAGQVVGDDAWRTLGADHRARRVTPWTALAFALARDLLRAPIPSAYFEAAGAAKPSPDLIRAAVEQLWDREPTSKLGVDGLVAAGKRGAFGTIAAYIRFFYAAPGADGRPWWRALGPRLRYDVTYRASRYLKALRNGEFRRDRLAHRARMLRERDALIAAIERPPAPSAPR